MVWTEESGMWSHMQNWGSSPGNVGAVKATRIRTDATEVSEVLRISRLRQVLDFLGQQTAIDLNREEVQQTVWGRLLFQLLCIRWTCFHNLGRSGQKHSTAGARENVLCSYAVKVMFIINFAPQSQPPVQHYPTVSWAEQVSRSLTLKGLRWSNMRKISD